MEDPQKFISQFPLSWRSYIRGAYADITQIDFDLLINLNTPNIFLFRQYDDNYSRWLCLLVSPSHSYYIDIFNRPPSTLLNEVLNRWTTNGLTRLPDVPTYFKTGNKNFELSIYYIFYSLNKLLLPDRFSRKILFIRGQQLQNERLLIRWWKNRKNSVQQLLK